MDNNASKDELFLKKMIDDGYYFCDPKKNKECKKNECFIHGGECRLTSDPACAIADDEFLKGVQLLKEEWRNFL